MKTPAHAVAAGGLADPKPAGAGLPRIAPYPLPAPGELPANRVRWPIDPARAALLIHDMQGYFLAAFSPGQPPLPGLLLHIQRLRGICRQAGVPVLFSRQPGGQTRSERGLLWDFWGPGIKAEPTSEAIVGALAPERSDLVIRKRRYSAFYRTNLLQALRGLGRDQLIVCGVYAHIGCLLTVADAFMNDLQAILVGDAVADFSAEHQAMALRYAADRCAMVVGTEQVVAALTVVEERVAP